MWGRKKPTRFSAVYFFAAFGIAIAMVDPEKRSDFSRRFAANFKAVVEKTNAAIEKDPFKWLAD
jgi:hypothetical protein